MSVFLVNGSLGSAVDITATYGRSPGKPSVIDNGPVLYDAIKPITDWNRYFFDTEVASVGGLRSCTWVGVGPYANTVVQRAGTGRHREAEVRWLPGTATDWRTANTFSPLWVGPLGPSSFDDLRLRGIAEAKTAGWDLGTLYAERRQTLAYIKQLVPAFFRQMKRARQDFGSWEAFREFLLRRGEQGASNNWLSLRYGLRPIVFDLMEAMERLTKNHDELFRITVQEVKTSSDQAYFNPGSISASMLPDGWTHSGGAAPSSRVGTGTVKVMRTYNARCGVGVKTLVKGKLTVNPALTAWEMVPFSFVVDWVLNIGDNILAWAPVVDRSLEYAWLTLKEEILYEAKASWVGPANCGMARPMSAPGNYYTGKGIFDANATTTIFARKFNRVRVSLADVPYGLAPQFNLDWFKVADLAAMLNQQSRDWARLRRTLTF